MENPKEYRYTKEHEWIAVEGAHKGRIGLTAYAQEMLGDIVYLKLPAVGTMVNESKKMGEVESVKAVSIIYSPLSGEVVAVNKKVKDSPQLVNEDPYGEGWLIEIKPSDTSSVNSLLDSEGYTAMVASATNK